MHVSHSLFMHRNDSTSILRLRRSTKIYSWLALKMISNANSEAVQNKLIFIHLFLDLDGHNLVIAIAIMGPRLKITLTAEGNLKTD